MGASTSTVTEKESATAKKFLDAMINKSKDIKIKEEAKKSTEEKIVNFEEFLHVFRVELYKFEQIGVKDSLSFSSRKI